MNILVCISNVPDTTSKINFKNNDTEFDSNGVQYIINPNDEFGLTRAIWFQEKNNAEVTVLTIGDQTCEPILRKCLAIGANKAIRIDAVPKGQLESARAIGMTDWQSMKNIILPQTLPIVLPPLTNQTLTLIKESAILSTITVHELTMTGLMVQGETFRPFEVFIMVALLYWALNETIATIMRRFEKNINKNKNTGPTNNSSAILKQNENTR